MRRYGAMAGLNLLSVFIAVSYRSNNDTRVSSTVGSGNRKSASPGAQRERVMFSDLDLLESKNNF